MGTAGSRTSFTRASSTTPMISDSRFSPKRWPSGLRLAKYRRTVAWLTITNRLPLSLASKSRPFNRCIPTVEKARAGVIVLNSHVLAGSRLIPGDLDVVGYGDAPHHQ